MFARRSLLAAFAVKPPDLTQPLLPRPLQSRVPDDHAVEAAYAIGRAGDPAVLPESLWAREAPSGRLPLAEIAFEGGFPG